MKALSLKQPWAELVLQEKKTIETRKWNTKFRGKFLIHASKNVDREKMRELGWEKELPLGKVVGSAFLKEVVVYDSEEKFLRDYNRHLSKNFCNPTYGFVLENVRRIKPFSIKGKLGFFEVNI